MTLLAPGSRRAAGSPGSARPAGSRPHGSRPFGDGPLRLELTPIAGASSSSERTLGPVGAVATGILLLAALVVQRTALPLLPWGPADLMTVLVVTLGLAFGPAVGCAYGFGLGLCADLISDHSLGRLAAVLCVVGYLGGLVPAERGRKLRYAVPVVALGCALVPLLFGLTGAFVGDTRAAGTLLLTRVAAGAAYGAVLTLVVHPLLPRLVAARQHRGRALSRLSRVRTRVSG